MAQVVEGRMQKEGENHGRLYFHVCKELGEWSVVFPKYELGFLCAFDLQYTKNCVFHRFHKEYVQMLKDASIIVFRPSNWVDVVDEVVDLVEC
jgi:hypothetical protein